MFFKREFMYKIRLFKRTAAHNRCASTKLNIKNMIRRASVQILNFEIRKPASSPNVESSQNILTNNPQAVSSSCNRDVDLVVVWHEAEILVQPGIMRKLFPR